VKEIIRLAHEKAIPVLLDGAQAVPHLKVNVADLDADFYVFSGHKFMDLPALACFTERKNG